MKKLFLVIFLGLIACAKGAPVIPPGDDNGRNGDPGKSNCQLNFKRSKDCASLTWVRVPTESTPGTFQLKFANEAGNYDVASAIKITADMEGMNHPREFQATRKGVGLYEVSSVRLSMRGEWIFLIQLVGESAILDSVRYRYVFN